MNEALGKLAHLFRNDPYTFWFFLFLAAFLAWCIGAALGLNRSDAASWVQALGSIGAILATWRLTSWQMETTMRHDRQQRIESLCDQLSAILELARLMQTQTVNLSEELQSGDSINIDVAISDWDPLFTTLCALAIHEYPYSLIAVEMVNARSAWREFRGYAGKHNSYITQHGLSQSLELATILRLGEKALEVSDTQFRNLELVVTDQIDILRTRASI